MAGGCCEAKSPPWTAERISTLFNPPISLHLHQRRRRRTKVLPGPSQHLLAPRSVKDVPVGGRLGDHLQVQLWRHLHLGGRLFLAQGNFLDLTWREKRDGGWRTEGEKQHLLLRLCWNSSGSIMTPSSPPAFKISILNHKNRPESEDFEAKVPAEEH